MNKITRNKQIPDHSIISKGFGRIDYFDIFHINYNSDHSIDRITTKLYDTPKWVNNLMKFRDIIVGNLGLKGSSAEIGDINQIYTVGDKAVRFEIIARNENEIVMEQKDKHLNFRTSVFMITNSDIKVIHLSTIVQYNNLFGRIYFSFVKPFHRLIIKSILKQID